MIQTVANALGIGIPEARFFVTLFAIFPLSFIYQLIPCNKNSSNFQQNILYRKLYGLVFGIILLLYIYTWDQLIATLLTFSFSYFGALRCRTPKKTLKWNLMNFVILTVAHLYRVIFYFNQDVYNINFILMMALPRQMYFNYWVLNIIIDKATPGQKNPLVQIKEDEEIVDKEIPSFFEYLCYMFNFVGNFTSPVYTYQEYKHFIQRTFDNKSKRGMYGLSKLFQFFLFVMVYLFKGKLLSDNQQIYRKDFKQQAIWYQLYVICVNSFVLRSRYYIGFLMGDLNGYLVNLRDSQQLYEKHTECIDIYSIETNCSPKIRIPAWNITIAKWLKYTIYSPFIAEFKLSTNQAALATFGLSAFWHGLQPNYYLAFFIVNLTTQIEKFVYRKKIQYFPKFFFYLIFDIGCTIFKTLDFVMVWKLVRNVWFYLFILIVTYFATRYAPKKNMPSKEETTKPKND